jgi:hypothetical protein
VVAWVHIVDRLWWGQNRPRSSLTNASSPSSQVRLLHPERGEREREMEGGREGGRVGGWVVGRRGVGEIDSVCE